MCVEWKLPKAIVFTGILLFGGVRAVASATPTVIINEIDYDQPGEPDSLEWVELKNNLDTEFWTLNAFLVFYNRDGQGNCHEYCRVDLHQTLGLINADGYAVLGRNPPCAGYVSRVSLCASTDAIDNGPSAVIVLEQDGEIIDSVEYGAEAGEVVCNPNFRNVPTADSKTVPGSIQRCGVHWVFSNTPTPCAPNNCTVADVPEQRGSTWGLVKWLYK